MKPNNLYYRQIATKLTGETYSKLYSDSYYARKIAEYYNEEPYTSRNPLNKYLEDWYVDLTGETAPTEHKPNLWYLRRLAKATDDSINEKILNENQCLHIIADGDAPTPSSDEIIFNWISRTFQTNVYQDTPFIYTGDVLIDWGDNTTETYTGGILRHDYDSSGEHIIKIKGNITGINDYTFMNSVITDVSLPNSITNLGAYCFSSCGLVSITLPNSLTTISQYCFNGSPNLTEITIPSSVTTLEENCFSETYLTTITIPNTVTSIASYSFSKCSHLTEIVLEWTESSQIIQYDSSWVRESWRFEHFIIPTGTTSLYEAKGYPSIKLQER